MPFLQDNGVLQDEPVQKVLALQGVGSRGAVGPDTGQGDKVIQADHIPVQYTGVGKPSGKSFSHRHNRQLLEGLSDGLK